MNAALQRIETERLVLRRWGRADRAAFAALNADPRVMEWLLGPISPDLSDAMIARIERHFDVHGFGLWAVERRDDARLIGFAGLQFVPFDAAFTPAVEIGWRLAFDAWGQGMATEAAAAALDDAVRRCDLARAVAFTVPANRRSQRVMEKLGFRRDPVADFDHPRLPLEHPLSRHWLYRWTPPEPRAC